MTQRVVVRGNTAFFSFTFYDANGDVAVCTSAELQLSYPGSNAWETEKITLANDSNVWSGQWVSTASRAGWVEYHAHGYAEAGDCAADGRFRLSGNRASFDHDALPGTATLSDYGLTP